MSFSSHIIGRQIIDLKVDRQADAFQIQEDISWTFRERLVPRLEKMLDLIVGPDTWVRLDRVEVDLGRLDPDRLEDSFFEEFLLKARLIIEREIKNAPQAQTAISLNGKSLENYAWQLLVVFLQKGTLPWWGDIKDENDWEEKIISLLNDQSLKVRQLATIFKKIPRTFSRWILQFSDPVLLAFFQNFDPVKAKQITRFQNTWEKVVSQLPEWKTGYVSIKEEIWRPGLRILIENENPEKAWKEAVYAILKKWALQSKIPIQELVEKILKILSVARKEEKTEEITFFLTLINELYTEGTGPPLSSVNDREGTRDGPPGLKGSRDEEGERNDLDEFSKKVEVGSTGKEGIEKSEGEFIEKERIKPLEDVDKEEVVAFEEAYFPIIPLETSEGIFIQNAGVVILHPFLLRYFETVNLVKEKDFIDEYARQRAIHLIQYLASGEEGFAEYKLTLNKLLCAMPLEIPMARDIILTTEEKTEANNLLTQVVKHWKALKSTSPDGLRHNYLLREGRLVQKSNGWQLLIEKKTHDILMNQLPWGISMIQLPWMQGLLRVEWN